MWIITKKLIKISYKYINGPVTFQVLHQVQFKLLVGVASLFPANQERLSN